jgi:hypothetical protein
MIKDERNYHKRLQEFADCYMETDLRKEIEKASRGLSGDPAGRPDELALKLLGLTILYGANENARTISLSRSKEGKVVFSVDARGKYQLPAPDPDVADRVIFIGRAITHLDADQGGEPFSMGLRNDRLELTFRFDRKAGAETMEIVFPVI